MPTKGQIGNYTRSKLIKIIEDHSTGGTGEGDIDGVTAGNGLTGGGTRGTVTLAVDIDSTTDGSGITVSTSDLLLVADVNDSNNVKKITVSQLPTGDSVGGSDTQFQYNDGGSAFGGVASMTYNDSTGNITIIDDKKLYFGSGGDASIEYDENDTDTLRFAGAAAVFEQSITLGNAAADVTTISGRLTASQGGQFTLAVDCDSTLNVVGAATFNNNVSLGDAVSDVITVTGQLTASGGISFTSTATFTDGNILYMGTDEDASISFDPTKDTHLVISGTAGADGGIVLSGSAIHLSGTLYGGSPIKFGDEIEFETNANNRAMRIRDNQSVAFGTSQDSILKYVDAGGETTPHFVISGSDAGIVLSGSAVKIDKFLSVGLNLEDRQSAITHGITLPNDNANRGKMKATAYTTYSSARYKTNIQPIVDPLALVDKLEGVTFDWRKCGTTDVGFVAEDVGKHLPGIVEWEPDGRWAQSMDYTRLVPILVESVKAQQKQIATLQTEISSLKKIK